MTRVRLHQEHEVEEPIASVFKDIAQRRDGVPNLHRALAGSPGLFESRLAYSNALRHNIKLKPSFRELAIMLVATLTHGEYEFAHHWKAAVKTGVTEQQLEAIADYRSSPVFSAEERAILDVTAEMTTDIAVSEETWRRAAAFLDEHELIDLVLVVGWYNQTSRVIAALGIELEPGYTAKTGFAVS